jgi:hypothetical protein
MKVYVYHKYIFLRVRVNQHWSNQDCGRPKHFSMKYTHKCKSTHTNLRKQDIWQEVAQTCTNVAPDVHLGLDLSSLLAPFLCVLESKIHCDAENLSMPVEARMAIYVFTMEEDLSNQKITNQLDLLF